MKKLIELFNAYNINYKLLVQKLEDINQKLENFIGLDWALLHKP